MKYAVTAPPRSGSHWMCDLISRIVDMPLINDDIEQWLTKDSVLHTHEIHKFVGTKLPQHCLVIAAQRKNVFDACISLEVAQRTNEWYYYSDLPVNPFDIDPDYFAKEIQRYQEFQNSFIEMLQQHNIPYVTCIYENLLASRDRYEYIADLIGYQQPVDPEKKDVVENRNTRDYKKIITNYDQLKNQWEEHGNA